MDEMPKALADLLAEFETITDRYERYELLTERWRIRKGFQHARWQPF